MPATPLPRPAPPPEQKLHVVCTSMYSRDILLSCPLAEIHNLWRHHHSFPPPHTYLRAETDFSSPSLGSSLPLVAWMATGLSRQALERLPPCTINHRCCVGCGGCELQKRRRKRGGRAGSQRRNPRGRKET